MTWRGPRLDGDQQALLRTLDAFIADRPAALPDDPEQVDGLIGALAELGLWTVGAAESAGGGGADGLTAGLVLERLGRAWPALGLASAQAQSAVTVLAPAFGTDERIDALVGGLHEGRQAVAVINREALLAGAGAQEVAVPRVDTAAAAPHLLIVGADVSTVVTPSEVSFSPIGRTGLDGALTRSAAWSSAAEIPVKASGDIEAARAQLLLGVAAVAAGIAGVAADAASSYASSRIQFGGPLTDLPTVRQSLADQDAAAISAATAALAGATGLVAAQALARDACESAIAVATSALQSHGGYGYLTEYPAERYLRDAISLRAAADLFRKKDAS